jgi:sarcosine oxidase
MDTTCDVVVVGGGAMGSATAWHLARRGRDVVLLEQFEPGHGRGSSHGGARIFRYAYPEDDYVRLAIHAERAFRELEDDAGESLLDITGGIDHGTPSRIDEQCDTFTRFGLPFERLTPDAAAERWPSMRFDRAVVAQPGAGRARADATVAACQRRASDHGADVRFNQGPSTVRVIDDGRVEVVGNGWSVRARVAVVTSGAWLPDVVGTSVGMLPTMKVTQEQIVHFADPRGDDVEWPSFIHHEDRVMSVYGLRTPGEGVKVGGHGEGPVVHPDARSFELDQSAVDARLRYLDRWLPGLDPTPVHGATCLYTTTADEDFVIDRVGPIVIGSPCSGHGFKFVPAIGALLADLAGDSARHHGVRRWMVGSHRS